MAARDVANFKFLKEALIQKFRRPQDLNFRGIPYDPFIFRLAYNTFRQLNLNEYLNIKDPNVLERFYLNLKKDARLKFLDNPDLFENDPIFELPEQYYRELPQEVVTQQQTMAETTPVSATPSVSLPHGVTTPSPAGVITTSTPPKETPTVESTLQEQPQTTTPQPQPAFPRVTMGPKIQVPKIPTGLASGVKNFTTGAGIFFQRNVGKFLTVGNIATGISGLIGGVVGAGLTGGSPLGILAGAGGGVVGRFWVGGGGGGQFFGRVGNGLINFGVGVSNQVSTTALIKGPSKKIWVGALIGAFMLFIGASALSGLIPGQTPPTEAAPVQAVASCPVPGGRISTSSYNADSIRGHCGSSYGLACRCGTAGRRAKAIDIPTNGKSVALPEIAGQQVKWRLIVGPYPVDSGEGGGLGYTFAADIGIDKWFLDMLHLNRTSLVFGVDYPSGTVVATTAADHVHTTIGKNLSQTPVAGTETDCDPNWLPSDFMCQ